MLNLTRITPGVRKILTVLVVATVAQWLIEWVAKIPVLQWTVFTPETLLQGQVWRVFTYLGSSPLSLGILFNAVGMWMFGSPVEEEIGTRRLYSLFAGCTLGGVLGCLISYACGYPTALAGASVAVVGVVMAFCVLYSQAVINILVFVFFVPIRASILGYLMIAYFILSSPAQAPAYLISMLAAYLALKRGGGSAKTVYRKFGQAARKSRLSAVSSVGSKVSPLRPSVEVAPSRLLSASEKEVDRILDKLRDEGMAALTAGEQETIDRHSRQLRQRDGL